MGCDIHLYAEYSNPVDGSGRKTYWENFGGRFGNRDYTLFGMLAGLRGGDALIEPRCLPDDLSYITKGDSILYIDDNGVNEGCCTLANAQQWEKYGSKIHYHNGVPVSVDHPDWYSHSWHTLEEFKAAVLATEKYNYSEPGEPAQLHGRLDVEYYGLIAALEKIQEEGKNVRLVFWFDN
jgi:hypothetical protein